MKDWHICREELLAMFAIACLLAAILFMGFTLWSMEINSTPKQEEPAGIIEPDSL